MRSFMGHLRVKRKETPFLIFVSFLASFCVVRMFVFFQLITSLVILIRGLIEPFYFLNTWFKLNGSF
jgi:hypothetical protein